MANLSRVLQKIFGDTGGTSQFGRIGSDAVGNPVTTKDLSDIQSLAQFESGLFSITSNAAEPPRIEDINSLYLLMTSQLAYLFQKGIPEWLATEEYYAAKSFCTLGGAIYRCVADSVNDNPATDDGTYWAIVTDPEKTEEIRIAIEHSHFVGEIFEKEDLTEPSAFDRSNPDDYFPAICLTDIDTHVDIDAANWPLGVDYLRNKKVKFKDGLTGEISSPSVTNWAISSNVATLTFANNPDTISFLAALLEDQVSHGSYTNWRTVTLANAIGNITAGTYAITNVNASSRTITFAFTAANASGAVTATVDFYAHRVAGSTTTARVFGARGLTMHGANDGNGYFVAGGLRRRGFMQQHYRHQSRQALITGIGWTADSRRNLAEPVMQLWQETATIARRCQLAQIRLHLTQRNTRRKSRQRNARPRHGRPPVHAHGEVHRMKYVVIKSGDTVTERHPIDNDVIEWAARITAESHNMEFPDEPWTVEIEDPDAQKNAEIELE
jgi:hypothetical protein